MSYESDGKIRIIKEEADDLDSNSTENLLIEEVHLKCEEESYVVDFVAKYEDSLDAKEGFPSQSLSLPIDSAVEEDKADLCKDSHLTMARLQFDRCNFVTNYKRVLEQHVIELHNSDEFRRDQLCNYVTESARNLSRHEDVHSSVQFACNRCGYVTDFKENIKGHVKIHYDTKEFKCDQCSFATKYKANLKCHIATFHMFEWEQCKQCDYLTTSEANLRKHVCHRIELKCPQCEFTTKFKRCLTKHIGSHHRSIKSSRNFTKDVNVHHASNVFKCVLCDFTTLLKTDLVGHVKTHRAFRCKQCDYMTRHETFLFRHLYINHTSAILKLT